MVKELLTENDQLVLDTIFNPLGVSLQEKARDDTLEVDTIPLELGDRLRQAIMTFQNGNEDEGILAINELLELFPEFSCRLHNDRAQMRSVRKEYEMALKDLDKSIEMGLSYNVKDSCALSQAYCQRAMVRAQLMTKKQDAEVMRNPFDADIPKESLEDFERASELGSKFAKMELQRLNPYAKMCNAMLAEYLNTSSASSNKSTNK